MTYATILAPIEGGPGSESVALTALAVGHSFNAYVELLHVQVDPASALMVPGDGISGSAAEEIMESVRAAGEERAAAAQKLFDEHCVSAELPVVEDGSQGDPGRFAVGWRRVDGDPMDEVARRARLFDLTVLAQPDASAGGVNASTFESALFYSGRPVLAVPAAWSKTCGGNIVLAWNGTHESVHALGASLPLLTNANRVTVFTVREDEAVASADQVSAYLARHGVAAVARDVEADGAPIAEALLGAAREAGADMLVMGGYGHSRLRELVLGGATRGVLNTAAIPVLMVH